MQNSKRYLGGFFELKILKIFTRLFYLKSLLELEAVYSGIFTCYKVFSLKMKKESPKRCEQPKKTIKILYITRKGGKMKNEKYKKGLTT